MPVVTPKCLTGFHTLFILISCLTKPSKNLRRYIGCVLEAPNLAIVTEPLGIGFRWRFGGGRGVVAELDPCIWPRFLQAWGLGLSNKALKRGSFVGYEGLLKMNYVIT